MPLIQPVQPPNIAQLIAQGLGAAGQFQQLQRQDARGAREDELYDLAQSIAANPQDKAAIARRDQLDPQGAAARQKQAFAQQKFQFEQEKFATEQINRDRARFDKGQAFMAQEIVNQPLPNQISSLKKYATSLGQDGSPMAAEELSSTQELIGVLESGDPAQIAQAQEMLRREVQIGQAKGYLKAPREQREPQELSIVRKLRAAGIDPNSAEGQRLLKADIVGQQQRIEVNPDGTISVVTGKGVGAGMQKKTKTDLEKKLVTAEENILNLNRIESQFKPAYLTYLGRGQAFLSGIKSKAGADLSQEERSFLGERRRFTENINRFFNAYRKDITGAAASVQELASLKKAMFNEDLSPAEFEASFDEFKNSVLRSQRLHRKLLREGVQGNLKNKRSLAAKKLDELYTTGADDSVDDRIKDLEAEKKTDEQMLKILEAEGYNIPQQ